MNLTVSCLVTHHLFGLCIYPSEVPCIVQLCFNAAPTESAWTKSDVISQSMRVLFESSEKLFSSIQLGGLTPDEIIDLGAVHRTSDLAHMLRTSLKTAISCLVLDVLLRQTTGACPLHHIGTCRCILEDRLPLNQGNFTCGTSSVFWTVGTWRCITTGHINDSVDDTLRSTLLENKSGPIPLFLPRLEVNVNIIICEENCAEMCR